MTLILQTTQRFDEHQYLGETSAGHQATTEKNPESTPRGAIERRNTLCATNAATLGRSMQEQEIKGCQQSINWGRKQAVLSGIQTIELATWKRHARKAGEEST